MSVKFLKPASSPFEDENDTPVLAPDEEGNVTVNLDDGEVVETPETPAAPTPEADPDDELKGLSEKTQKRINTLRYEFHNAERMRTAAVTERDQIAAENKRLKDALEAQRGQSHQTTTALADSMVKTTEDALKTAQQLLAKAHTEGDSEAIAKQTGEVSRLSSELTAIKANKSQYDASWQQQEAARKQAPAPQPQAPQQPQQPQVLVAEAQQWLAKNPWFTQTATDPAMAAKQQAVLAYNNNLIQTGKYGVNDPRLYQEVDAFIQKHYPEGNDQMNNGQSSPSGQPPVAGVQTTGANPSGKKSRTMKLTASQLEIARKLNLTPKQYALSVQKLEG